MTGPAEVYPGWICPNCKVDEINIVAIGPVRVTVDGITAWEDCSYVWEDDSRAFCQKCQWEGTANDAAQAAQEKYPQLVDGSKEGEGITRSDGK